MSPGIPAKAFAATKLPQLDLIRDVLPMSLEEAHTRLLPFFPKYRKHNQRWKRVWVYMTPAGMRHALLDQNYKTGKTDPNHEGLTEVQGLSLLPNFLGFGPGLHSIDLTPYKLAAVGPVASGTLCLKATADCRKACLVYSGQNASAKYNAVAKRARTRALLTEPVAFLRMLVEAIRFHRSRAARGEFSLYIRLNVFSDIPWELFCPNLFTYEFAGTNFYDYTKVWGRDQPSNYDLTFSWSGANREEALCELARGRRLAVVFGHPQGLPRLEAARRPRDYGLPNRFLGHRVVDGDVSDVRPRDSNRVIVGLRYKQARGQAFDPGKSRFVVATRVGARDEVEVVGQDGSCQVHAPLAHAG